MTAGFFLITLAVFLFALAAFLVSRHKITTEPRNEYRKVGRALRSAPPPRSLNHDRPVLIARVIR